jgi:hypothetical protein
VKSVGSVLMFEKESFPFIIMVKDASSNLLRDVNTHLLNSVMSHKTLLLVFNKCNYSTVSRATRPSKTYLNFLTSHNELVKPYLKVSVHCTTCFDRH